MSDSERVEQGKALAALRMKMLDYAGNLGYQQWKAARTLPALSEHGFSEVVAKIEGFGLTPIAREISTLFMPQRCLLQDVGHHLRKYRDSKRPISPYQKISQLEEQVQALKAQVQALQGVI